MLLAWPRLAALLGENSRVPITAALWFHKFLVSGLLSEAPLPLFELHIWVCHIKTYVQSQRAGGWLPAAHPVPSHLILRLPQVTPRHRNVSVWGFLPSLAVFWWLLNVFIELNEFPPGSIHSTAFAASALFMERGGNIKYKREIMHKPAEISMFSVSCVRLE